MRQILFPLFLFISFGFVFTPQALAATPACPQLTVNMSSGTSDALSRGEVSRLQDFLRERGFLASESTGYFRAMTKKAVIDFQASKNLPAIGYVGPLTRKAILSSCADMPAATPAPAAQAPAPVPQQAAVLQAVAPAPVPAPAAAPTLSLPYQAISFEGWVGTWGLVSTTSGALSLHSGVTTSGAEAEFPPSNSWQDYRYTAEVVIGSQAVTLIGRYVDSENFAGCTFSGNWVGAIERVKGETKTLGEKTITREILSGPVSTRISMLVQGDTIGCGADGPYDNVTATMSGNVKKGCIGISTWYSLIGAAKLDVLSVKVEVPK